MRNTARVIHALSADVLAVVQAESRAVLEQFNQQILKAVGGQRIRDVMVIDGNDTRAGPGVLATRTHVHTSSTYSSFLTAQGAV